MKHYSWLLLLFLTFILAIGSCRKESENPVPAVYVDFYIYLSQPGNVNLNSPGGWNYYTGGSRGIIVYRLNIDEFKAYDRNCTYNPSASTSIVSVDSSGLFAVDTSCTSRFVLIDGSVNAGPATVGLKQYRADYDGSNIVHIHN